MKKIAKRPGKVVLPGAGGAATLYRLWGSIKQQCSPAGGEGRRQKEAAMKNVNPLVSAIVGGVMLLAAPCLCAQDWPQWRGPNRDAVATGFKAPKTWPKELTRKWKV